MIQKLEKSKFKIHELQSATVETIKIILYGMLSDSLSRYIIIQLEDSS